MYARSTTVHGNPQSLDDAIAYCRDEVMPAAQRMDGCIGMSMMCDRDTGRCIATTAWESEEAMHNSEGGLHDGSATRRCSAGRPRCRSGRSRSSTACTTHRKAPVAGCCGAATRTTSNGWWTPCG